MNILFLGSRYINSTSMCLGPEMSKVGFKWCGFIDTFAFVKKYIETYRNTDWNKHYVGKIPMPLSFLYRLLPKTPDGKTIPIDFVLVEQNGFHFYNDTEMPVIYYDRDIPTPLFMQDMDVLHHEHGIKYPEAKRILQQSEAVLIVPGTKAYVTRKIYEAAMCKTLVILFVENEEALEIFTEIGLEQGKNCIMFRKKEQLKKISSLKRYDVKKIIDNAHKWVNERHLWVNRAIELKKICDDYRNTKTN